VLKGMLFGLSFYDPAAVVIAIVGLLGFATAAAFVPASRASRANPADLLRET
jgi:ABC-type lipoprotein release transport system permease subunit